MAKRVCPWWLGYLLASPIRCWLSQPPDAVLAPYVRCGMLVLEPGPGMGYFTVPLAQMVGPSGRVIAVDIQPKMLAGLKRRLAKAGLIERVDIRLAKPDSLGLDDLSGKVDLTLVFAVLHEMPDEGRFFAQAAAVSKPGASLLLVEPSGHVKPEAFDAELRSAADAGFELVNRPSVRRSHAALLRKS